MVSSDSRPYDWTWASTKKPWWSEAWVWPVALLLTAICAAFVAWMAVSPVLPSVAPHSTIVTQYFDFSEVQGSLTRFVTWYVSRPIRLLIAGYLAIKLVLNFAERNSNA